MNCAKEKGKLNQSAPAKSRWLRRVFVLLCGFMIMAFTATESSAQADYDFLPRTSTYPPYRTPQSMRYNLKWGKMTGRLSASVQFEYNDNVNLAEVSPHADFSISPELGLGILWPIDDMNVLQLDMSVGYRWYLNSPGISTVTVAPSQVSHVDYYLMLGAIRVNIHDNFSTQVDPVDIGTLNGTSASLINFRRYRNTSGLTLNWQARKDLGFSSGYDYTIDRSFSGQFLALDRDEHSFSAGMNYQLSPRISVGVAATYSLTDYLLGIQNDGSAYTLGPRLSWKLSPFLTLDASASYTVSQFDNTGTIGDTSQFQGYSYQVGVTHILNRRMTQTLRIGDRIDLGIGNNFTEVFSAQHGLRVQISSPVSIATTLAYEHLESSGALGEAAERYLFSIGTGFQISKNWSTGMAYTLSWKDSDQPGRDYVQNRLTVDLTRQF